MEPAHKCRRTLRDEEAGLLFRWRVGRGSTRRMVMAVVLALVMCGLGVMLIRVEGGQAQADLRDAGRVTVLTPGTDASRRWLEWARQEAPYLDQWEPAVEGTLQVRMQRFESSLLRQVRHEPLLRPAVDRTVRVELPTILDPLRPPLPEVKREMERSAARTEVEAHLFTEASASLRERWGNPPPTSPVHALIGDAQGDDREALRPRELLGLERRFRGAVNRRGIIETCQPLGAGDSVLDAIISRWLRAQRLAIGTENLVWGDIEVHVRGRKPGLEQGND